MEGFSAVILGTFVGCALAFMWLLMGALGSMGIQDRETQVFGWVMIALATGSLLGGIAWGILRFAAVI